MFADAPRDAPRRAAAARFTPHFAMPRLRDAQRAARGSAR